MRSEYLTLRSLWKPFLPDNRKRNVYEHRKSVLPTRNLFRTAEPKKFEVIIFFDLS